MDFAKWLVLKCYEQKVKQSEIAEACGCTQAAVSKWANGKGLPSPIMLRRVEAVFGEKYLPDEGEDVTPNAEREPSETTEDFLQKMYEEEKALLMSYRTMTDEQRKMMQVFIRGIKGESKDAD